MKNEQVAEIYANGNGEAKTKHLFIEGRVIYSYGYHFPIAFKLNDKKVLFNKDGYSMTTSRHKNMVKRELEGNGWELIEMNTEQIKNTISQNILNYEEIVLNAL